MSLETPTREKLRAAYAEMTVEKLRADLANLPVRGWRLIRWPDSVKGQRQYVAKREIAGGASQYVHAFRPEDLLVGAVAHMYAVRASVEETRTLNKDEMVEKRIRRIQAAKDLTP